MDKVEFYLALSEGNSEDKELKTKLLLQLMEYYDFMEVIFLIHNDFKINYKTDTIIKEIDKKSIKIIINIKSNKTIDEIEDKYKKSIKGIKFKKSNKQLIVKGEIA